MTLGFGDRMRRARMAVAARLGRSVSQGAMAQLVSEELARLGSDRTVSQSAWSAYESETSEPSLIVFRAASRVSGLSESFLGFGADFDALLQDGNAHQVSAVRERLVGEIKPATPGGAPVAPTTEAPRAAAEKASKPQRRSGKK